VKASVNLALAIVMLVCAVYAFVSFIFIILALVNLKNA
jgi:hypothetical protein